LELSAAMVNQICVITPGPSEANSSRVAPGWMGHESALPPVRSKLDCLSER
jgi:hypothetical protein